jgi:hypothetical protein
MPSRTGQSGVDGVDDVSLGDWARYPRLEMAKSTQIRALVHYDSNFTLLQCVDFL